MKIAGKRRKQRPGIDFTDHIKEKVKVSGYSEVKKLARDREELRMMKCSGRGLGTVILGYYPFFTILFF